MILDTNILLYAVGGDHPLRPACADLIGRIGRGEQRATTTVEAIQEFAHVRARRRSRNDAIDLANSFIELLNPLIVPDADLLRRGLAWFGSEKVGAFDGVLVAAAFDTDQPIASADRAFSAIEGLTVLDPSVEGWLDEPGGTVVV